MTQNRNWWKRCNLTVERRSTLRGASRTEWEHSIPAVDAINRVIPVWQSPQTDAHWPTLLRGYFSRSFIACVAP